MKANTTAEASITIAVAVGDARVDQVLQCLLSHDLEAVSFPSRKRIRALARPTSRSPKQLETIQIT